MTMRIALSAAAAGLCAAGVMTVAPIAAHAAAVPRALSAGSVAHVGNALRSPNGRFVLQLQKSGRLRVVGPHGTVWARHARGDHPTLVLRRGGDMVLKSRQRVAWQTHTIGAGRSTLRLTNSGVLKLRSSSGNAWTSALGNRCHSSWGAHHVTIDISQQRAVLCAGHEQVLITRVTTGASAYGNGTPTGEWRLYAKVRNTVLYPSSGGAYPVKYWMPYDGAYGMHDSSWQHYRYGSSRYRTEGSHGCTHFPRAAVARMYEWAPIGTVVTIHY